MRTFLGFWDCFVRLFSRKTVRTQVIHARPDRLSRKPSPQARIVKVDAMQWGSSRYADRASRAI